ncbi:hypothetical protein ACFVTM_19080 [Arthrobacter sp. NPDC058130]|uniref:hypothetical protein n=1 Tax=Arthrobacter sp. NPDC058130 TaxID=3346353 RepID=UPI0036E2D307
MNPLRKAAALALLLPAAALIALTGAASATAENATGDLDAEGPSASPTASPTDRSHAEPDMTDVAPAAPFVCPEGHVHVFYNDVDTCATVGPDGEPDPAGIVLDPSGGVLKPAGSSASATDETPEPAGSAVPAPSTPSAEPTTQGPSAAAEAPSSASAQAPSASSASSATPIAAEEAASDIGPVLVIIGVTVALLLVAAGAFVWERHREDTDS